MKNPLLLCIAALGAFVSCQDIVKYEEHLPDPSELKIQDEFQLGRALFYDTNLSADNSIACASCHQQSAGFADNRPLSVGVHGRMTKRNSMPIQNITAEGSIVFDSTGFVEDSIGPTPLFWDGREPILAKMVLMPFLDHNEHGLADENELVAKVKAQDYYQDAFQRVYGSEADADLIANSLSIFVLSLQSQNTKLDRFLQGNETLNEQELKGFELFFTKYDCNSCHQVNDPSGYLKVNNGGFADIGLEINPDDQGKFLSTGLTEDIGKFKIPSLRNVALTAPYMHDGRFANLDSVIEHYSDGMLLTTNLDQALKDENGQPLVLNISKDEREQLVAFLRTLTDQSLPFDPQFSNPFDTD